VEAGCFPEKVGGAIFSVGELQADRQARKNFGKLLLGKVTKIVATRCHILRLKWGD